VGNVQGGFTIVNGKFDYMGWSRAARYSEANTSIS
jgi:hypothetical protein